MSYLSISVSHAQIFLIFCVGYANSIIQAIGFSRLKFSVNNMLFGNTKKNPRRTNVIFKNCATSTLTTDGMGIMKLIFVLLALAALSSVQVSDE